MKIGIIGTRGVPNQYGGFEQFAEHLSAGLAKKGHEIIVYSSHTHSYQEKKWEGVDIVHCYDPEFKLGTAGQFVYDLNCILDAHKRNFDLLLFLGYTSSSVWKSFYPKKTLIISNMDGLEWKRTKYSRPVQRFLLYAEKLAVKHSHYLIADSIGIKEYLKKKYGKESVYIPYGATIFKNPNERALLKYDLQPFAYNMLMARMEPENNIEMILDGFSASSSQKNFIVVGNTANKFGSHIRQKFAGDARIFFLGAIYDQDQVNNLRYFSHFYFHGHSVGGTNPSLLEAMASNALIVAHDNIFNSAVLGEDAFYFTNAKRVTELVETGYEKTGSQKIVNNIKKIEADFNWDKIIMQYENYFIECYSKYKS